MSLENIWHSWRTFRKGKQSTPELERFQYHLEAELFKLATDLQNGTYRHGTYKTFVVCDNKRREIAVAGIRDRVVHRLLYDYLNLIYDRSFIYDAWLCRKEKGLLGAIERAQRFLDANPDTYIWKADIRKFFDHVDHEVLLNLLSKKITDGKALQLLKEVICSFSKAKGVGVPIGNLTSQILANIYLNELDRFVKHELKAKHYLRYGDDFIVLGADLLDLGCIRRETIGFLEEKLKLQMNTGSDLILKAKNGLKFLGVWIYSGQRTLSERNCRRLRTRLTCQNAASYYGLVQKHGSREMKQEFGFLLSGTMIWKS